MVPYEIENGSFESPWLDIPFHLRSARSQGFPTVSQSGGLRCLVNMVTWVASQLAPVLRVVSLLRIELTPRSPPADYFGQRIGTQDQTC
jgi:hypothetical protein